jgi:hypothetical protein
MGGMVTCPHLGFQYKAQRTDRAMRDGMQAFTHFQLFNRMVQMQGYLFNASSEHSPTAAKVSSHQGYVTFWHESRFTWYL